MPRRVNFNCIVCGEPLSLTPSRFGRYCEVHFRGHSREYRRKKRKRRVGRPRKRGRARATRCLQCGKTFNGNRPFYYKGRHEECFAKYVSLKSKKWFAKHKDDPSFRKRIAARAALQKELVQFWKKKYPVLYKKYRDRARKFEYRSYYQGPLKPDGESEWLSKSKVLLRNVRRAVGWRKGPKPLLSPSVISKLVSNSLV